MKRTDAVSRYLRHHRVDGSSHHTVSFHEYSLKNFLRYLTETGHPGTIDDLGADDLRGFIEWLREHTMAQATVAARSRSVQARGAWLASEELGLIHSRGQVRPRRPVPPRQAPLRRPPGAASCARSGSAGGPRRLRTIRRSPAAPRGGAARTRTSPPDPTHHAYPHAPCVRRAAGRY